MPIQRWGDYEIDFDQLLGRGGMGAVYRGRQVSVDRPAAIKVLKKELTENPEFVKRFQREAALLARLVDTHVVQVFGAGEAEGHHFYAMEFVEGEDLSARLKRGYRFTVEEVLQVAFRVARALSAAWRHRIVHRDIKPSNIIVTKDGTIKVMDFGLAKNPEMDYTQSEVIMGTAKYMSPEQAQGQPCDIRSDLYSLGAVLYEIATGRPPFSGDTLTALLYQQVHKPPIPPRDINPSIPPPLEAVILRLLAKSPSDRYQTPDELIAAVWPLLEEVSPEERTTLMTEVSRGARRPTTALTKPDGTSVPRKGGIGRMAAALLAGLAVAAGGGYLLFRHLQPPAGPAPDEAARAPEPPASTEVPKSPPPGPPVPEPPPGPPSAPSPPPAPPPPPAPAWEEARRRGLEALAAGQWAAAYTNLEQARALGATDLDEKINQARARDLLDKGDAQTDDERALEHYAQALTYVNDPEIARKVRGASFRIWSRRAERHQGADWAQAAECWSKAAGFAEEDQKASVEANGKFCLAYAEALRARLGGDWKRALELFRELAREPRGHADAIEKEIRKAEEALAAEAEAERERARKEFADLAAQLKAVHGRLAWDEVLEIGRRLEDPKFSGIPREEIRSMVQEARVARAAPPGMVYVPPGEFLMGDPDPRAPAVEGPPGKVVVKGFYIDLRETTVGEYGEFLRALESSGGHHPGCPKDEPAGKSHVPEGWEGQKDRPEAPVVGVDWWDAASCAAWRKKRLPTEAEWERAAGFEPGGRRLYPWGNAYRKEGGRSFLGCEGMGDGVIEWTGGTFDRYPWSPATHFDFGRKKALRGGVLLAEFAERDARVTHRHSYPPSYRSKMIGFRCARDLSESQLQEER